jgi:hypothetical protein
MSLVDESPQWSRDRVIKNLNRHWKIGSYTVDRQTGSHILVESDTPVIAQRNSIAPGLIRSIPKPSQQTVSFDGILRDL